MQQAKSKVCERMLFCATVSRHKQQSDSVSIHPNPDTYIIMIIKKTLKRSQGDSWDYMIYAYIVMAYIAKVTLDVTKICGIPWIHTKFSFLIMIIRSTNDTSTSVISNMICNMKFFGAISSPLSFNKLDILMENEFLQETDEVITASFCMIFLFFKYQ